MACNICKLYKKCICGDCVIVPKEKYQNLINIKSLAVEAHKRFIDYDMSVDCDVPHEHRDFMRRLKKHLEI